MDMVIVEVMQRQFDQENDEVIKNLHSNLLWTLTMSTVFPYISDEIFGFKVFGWSIAMSIVEVMQRQVDQENDEVIGEVIHRQHRQPAFTYP